MDQSIFRALADPTRREILLLLRDRDMTIAEVAAKFEMTRAAVRKHLTVLTESGLITIRAVGRERFNSLEPQGMAPIHDWLKYFDSFWDKNLSALKSAIEKDQS